MSSGQTYLIRVFSLLDVFLFLAWAFFAWTEEIFLFGAATFFFFAHCSVRMATHSGLLGSCLDGPLGCTSFLFVFLLATFLATCGFCWGGPFSDKSDRTCSQACIIGEGCSPQARWQWTKVKSHDADIHIAIKIYYLICIWEISICVLKYIQHNADSYIINCAWYIHF